MNLVWTGLTWTGLIRTDLVRNSPVQWIIWAVVAAALPAVAQVVPRVELYTTYSDNVFQNVNQRSDWITQANIDFDWSPTGALNLYYSGNANVFSEFSDLFNHTHGMGLTYQRPGEGRDLFYAGGEVALRLDQPDYAYREFVEASGFANYKTYWGDALLARASYTVRLQEYLNASEYSFAEQSAFVQVSRFLPSRTTLQAGAELGLKTYLRDAGALTDGVEARAGNGRNLIQWVGRAKLAQALASSAGLQAEYVLRTNLSGSSRFADTQLYNPDDDLFDDRFAYEGHRARTKLKYLAGASVLLQAGASWEKRRYPGRPALDLDGFLLDSQASRRDTRRSLSLEAGRSFFPVTGLASELRLSFEWRYTDTDSNDPYYDAGAQSYSLGLNLDF